MRKFIPLIGLLFIAAAVLGWLRAGTSAGTRPAEVDNWNALQSGASQAGYKDLTQTLKQSALLPLSYQEQSALEAAKTEAALTTTTTANTAGTSTPPFPKILGSSRLNRIRYVHVLAPDKSITKLRGGDVLDSGWEIKTVDRKQVIAVFDGEELTVPVIPYLEGAFDKPDEDTDDEDTNNVAGSGGE